MIEERSRTHFARQLGNLIVVSPLVSRLTSSIIPKRCIHVNPVLPATFSPSILVDDDHDQTTVLCKRITERQCGQDTRLKTFFSLFPLSSRSAHESWTHTACSRLSKTKSPATFMRLYHRARKARPFVFALANPLFFFISVHVEQVSRLDEYLRTHR